jgi:heat shock protein HslJ
MAVRLRPLCLAAVFGVLVLVAVMTGCQGTGGPADAAPIDLAGTAWLAEDIDGRGVIDVARSTLSFEGDRAAGSTGCNRYFGPFSVQGDALGFGPLATTRRACPPALMDQEQHFLTALESVTRYAYSRKGLLYLYDQTGAQRLRLSRTDEP